MKKYLLLILCLVSSLMASAESGTCGDNLTWSLEDGILVISGTGAMTDYFNSSNVPWYSSRSTISLVIISEGVTSIGDCAFSGCSSLTSITIPNSVTSIGDYAFHECSSLPSITIPNSVTSIGGGAFWKCSGLTSITIPDGVTSIGDHAFRGCSGLTSINIPNSVTSIGELAFEGCFGLTSINIPNSVTSIGRVAFSGCSGLTSVTIGNSVTSIGGSAFLGCSGLTSINIPNSVTSIGSTAFSCCSGLTSINIPNSVTSIGGSAFDRCSGLTSITIPNSVTSIEGRTFSGCSGLTSINIPNSVTSIGNEAFYDCYRLTSITIPNSVTSIGSSAFYNCNRLTSITIPNSVTSIGGGAFYGCDGLTSVKVLATTPPTCGSDLLNYAGTSTIHVYEEFADVYKSASGWSSYNIVDDIPVTRVTGMTLDATQYLCGVGKRFTPQVVTYMPEDATIKEVTWSSSDPSVLTIVASTGACIGIKDGIATITATAKDAGHATVSATVYVGNAMPEGTVTITASSANETMGTVTGGGPYLPGTTVTLTAKPAIGYEFQSWSDGSTENPYTFEATEGKELVAYFRSTWVTISASSANEQMGSVSGDGTFLPGTTVTLTATPAIGYEFQSWSDGTTENPYVFTASENKELVANFVWDGIPRYKIEHVQSGLYLKFDPSVTETNSDNVLSLANEGTLFIVESTTDGYSFYSEEAEEYLTTNGLYSWNPGHSTSPSYWQLEETTGGYYIKKDGSNYCAPDGVTAGQHVYTDKMANNANGAVFELVLAISGVTVGIEAPSISNDVAHAIALDGRIVKNTKARGLYIVNGKKVLR